MKAILYLVLALMTNWSLATTTLKLNKGKSANKYSQQFRGVIDQYNLPSAYKNFPGIMTKHVGSGWYCKSASQICYRIEVEGRFGQVANGGYIKGIYYQEKETGEDRLTVTSIRVIENPVGIREEVKFYDDRYVFTFTDEESGNFYEIICSVE